MNKVTIQGKEYPYKLTVRAFLDYQEKFEKDFLKEQTEGNFGMDLPEMMSIISSCLVSGAKLAGEKLEIELDDLPDFLDMLELAELVTVAFKDVDNGEDKNKKK